MIRTLRRTAPVTVASLGLLLLFRANDGLNHNDLSLTTVVALALGLGCWVAGLRSSPELLRPPRSAPGVRAAPHRVQLALLAAAVPCSAGAWVWAADNMFRAAGVVFWIGAIVAWLAGWWPSRTVVRARAPWWDRRLVPLCVVLTVAVGAFFRLYRIDQTPLDPTSDHAEKLLDVTDVLDGERPIFFERNTGREPAQFYFSAALFRLLDLPTDFVSLKIGTALIGVLAIPFVFLLAKELAGTVAGLVAAAFYAVCTWPVEIARAGLRFPYAPVAAAAALWLLLRWMRTRDRRDLVLCGLSLGIGLHGYTPIRVVVPALVLGVVIAFLDRARRALRRQAVEDGLLMAATAGIVFLPLGRYAVEHPDMFWQRATGRVTGGSGEHALAVFATNNLNAALGFNWRGDSTAVNAVTSAPMLDQVTGALLIAGVSLVLVRAARDRDPRAIHVLAALPILLLASTLSIAFPHENPSVNRMGPAAPLLFAIIALPVAHWARRLGEVVGPRRSVLVAAPVVAVLIGIAAARSFDQYFDEFDRQTRAGVPNTTAIAQAIEAAEALGVDQDDAYVVDRAHWLDVRNVGIALGDVDWGPAHSVPVDAPLPDRLPDRPMLLVVHGEDDRRLEEVRRTYPDAAVTAHVGPGSQRFETVVVAGASR